MRSGDVGLSLLKHIDNNHGRLITGNQVEMEYKKNRQRVIIDSLKNFGAPDWNKLTSPAFLTESKYAKAIKTKKNEIERHQKTLKKKIEKVLYSPKFNDPIYRTLQRLFRGSTPFNLTRDKEVRFEIRELATKRFALGYPPRKSTDTSMGDAINWEWIIRCANDSGNNIIIVSRDSDYGVSYSKNPILNDWLLEEFRERVSRKRIIKLTNRLSHAFKMASISVTKEEEQQEEELIDEIKATREWEQYISGFLRGTLDAHTLKELEEGISDKLLFFKKK